MRNKLPAEKFGLRVVPCKSGWVIAVLLLAVVVSPVPCLFAEVQLVKRTVESQADFRTLSVGRCIPVPNQLEGCLLSVTLLVFRPRIKRESVKPETRSAYYARY